MFKSGHEAQPSPHKLRHIVVTAIAGAVLSFVSTSAAADGEFIQFDLSETTSTGTVSIARGSLTFGASAVSYENGRTFGLSATYKLPVAEQIATLRLGPALGYVKDDGADGSFEAGLKLVAERYILTDFGSLFLLADLNSIEASAFVLAQFGLSRPGLAIEVTHGESETYSETSLGIAKQLRDGSTSLRAGYRFDAEEVFVGLSINTF